MPGIIPPLEPYDGIGMVSQQIDDLPLAFVSPLGSYNNDISHILPLPMPHAMNRTGFWTVLELQPRLWRGPEHSLGIKVEFGEPR
jgi:hypothetical protein